MYNNSTRKLLFWIIGVVALVVISGLVYLVFFMNSKSNLTTQTDQLTKGWRYAGVFSDSAVNVTTLKLPNANASVGAGARYVAYYSSGQPGTGRKQAKRAFSDDGLTWTPDAAWTCPDLCDRPDGPDGPSSLPHRDHLTLKDSRIRTYVSSKDGIISFISTDGLSWTKEEGVRLTKDPSVEWEQGSGALVDWSAIYLPDGKVRAYYQGQRKAKAGEDCGDCYVVASAISSDDGMTFTRELGLRLDPLELGYTFNDGRYGFSDAAVVKIDEQYRAFFGDYAGPIASASSKDGLKFTLDGPLPLWGANPSVTELPDGRLMVLAGQGQGPDSVVCPGKTKCPENYNLEHMLVWEPMPVTLASDSWDNSAEQTIITIDGVTGTQVSLKVIEGTGMSCKYDFDKQQNVWEPGCYFDPTTYTFEPNSGTVPFTTTLSRKTDPSLVRTEHTVLFTATVDGNAYAGAVRCIHRAFSGDPYCKNAASSDSTPPVDSSTSTPPPSDSAALLTVSFPQKDSTITASDFEVRGTTKSGYEVRMYLDNSETITAAAKASGTAEADSIGSFTLKHTGAALTPGTHILRVATLPKGSSTIDPASITEVVFTVK